MELLIAFDVVGIPGSPSFLVLTGTAIVGQSCIHSLLTSPLIPKESLVETVGVGVRNPTASWATIPAGIDSNKANMTPYRFMGFPVFDWWKQNYD
jgi:hypothetical protein